MIRDRFSRFSPREKTAAEELIELKSELALASAEACRANRENQILRQKLGESERYRKAAEQAAWQANSQRLDLQLNQEKLLQENQELQKQLADMNVLKEELANAQAEIKRLCKQLNIRQGSESPFGLSTPSSRMPLKKNSSDENRNKKGGAQPGHKGSGWRRDIPETSEKEILVPTHGKKECCHGENLEMLQTHTDVITRYIPGYFRKTQCTYGIFKCKTCGHITTGPIKDVFPGMKYDIGTIAEIMKLAYEEYLPYGLIARRMKINKGTLFGILHRMSEHFMPLFEEIKRRIAMEPFLHADETSWRTDGHSGYSWMFTNDQFRLLLFRETRASSVPLEILGQADPELVLVSDRYAGYSPLNVRHQYCYIHLMRDLKNMLENDPDNVEVKSFVPEMLSELKNAVALQGKKELSNSEYQHAASMIRENIMNICNSDARDGAVRAFQDLFREKHDSLFQWVENRSIPCHNNNAERRLRPVVIARKISMGCQGEKGRISREILGTIVQTAVARNMDVVHFLTDCMRKMLDSPGEDLFPLLC